MSIKFLTKLASKLDEHSGNKKALWVANAIDMAIEDAVKSTNAEVVALERLVSFANAMDVSGNSDIADSLDAVVVKVAEKTDGSALYDYKAHREQTLFDSLRKEENKVEPVFDNYFGDGSHPLLTRYSPDYPGVMLQRVSDGVYQDTLSKKVYDFRSGFISDTGIKYHGGSVAHQTPTAENYRSSPQLLESQHLTSRPR